MIDANAPSIRASIRASVGPVVIAALDRLSDADRAEIKAYLNRVEGPALAHQPEWMEIFRHGLGHRPTYLLARREGALVGVLPLAQVSSWLFGRFLVSLPYVNQGGPLADDDVALSALIDAAVDLADRSDVKYLELRSRVQHAHPKLTKTRSDKVLMWLDLPRDAESLWKSFKPEVRNQIRKGEKSGLTVHWGHQNELDAFYDVFAVNMRDLGTPVFGRSLFQSMLDELKDNAELCIVRLEGLPIAGALLLHGGGHTEVPSASSLREHNKTCANMLMYHHLLLRAIERGQQVFDFGRSSEDSGTFKFKRQWGAKPTPSHWQYHLRRGEIGEVRPDHPKYQRKIETWKKLPLWVTRLLGPSIVRGIP